MDIAKAKPTDYIEILYLLKVCIADMQARGFLHWNNAFPDIRQIEQDIIDEIVFLAKDKGVCKGMITLRAVEPEEYSHAGFTTTLKPLVIQHVAVHPDWKDSEIDRMMLDLARTYAGQNGFGCLRTDSWQWSTGNGTLPENLQFMQAGTLAAGPRNHPIVCYEIQL
jgi:hypothetical protein